MYENDIPQEVLDICVNLHKELGLLINFNEKLLKQGFIHIVNGLEDS